jgi:integrase
MRQQEISKLKRGWSNLSNALICLPAAFTKTRQAREIPVPKDLIDDLGALCADKAADEPLFARGEVSLEKRKNLGTWWENAKVRARVDCRFHDLRITCATRMAEAGIPLAYACDILGHDREVNKIYVRTLNRERKHEEIAKMKWDSKWNPSHYKKE